MSQSRKEFAQSQSFLFGILSFFLSPDTDNFNEVKSCSSLSTFNCQLALQQCFGAALCKTTSNPNPFDTLLSATCPNQSSNSLLLSRCCPFPSVFGVFFGFLLFFFSSEEALMLFRSWEASGLDLCCRLVSLLFIVL